MAQHAIEQRIELALRLADRADEVAMAGFFSYFEVETKPDGSPVTSVDRRVEAAVRDMISTDDPVAGMLGEEYGETPGRGRWVIDPIDGTAAFIEGDPRFGVLIAHEVGGVATVGVVSAPALGLRWWAGRGIGAYTAREGVVSAARVSIVSDLGRARALLPGSFLTPGSGDGSTASLIDELVRARTTLGPIGSSWQGVRVATGDYDIAVTAGARWDVAPLPVIVEESGGCASVRRVGEDGYSLVLTNRQLRTAIVADAAVGSGQDSPSTGSALV